MARIRTVKPEYPQHRKTRKVCRDARLLNIHLWNLADDAGRLQELPLMIIGAVFPSDEDVTPAVLKGWLEELASVGLITRYEVDGEPYIQCHDFNDHQAISKKKPSVLPPCDAESRHSGSDPEPIPDSSRGEGNGMEEEGNGMDAAASTRVAPVHQPILAKLSEVAFARNLTDPKVEAVVEVNVAFAQFDLEAEAAKFAAYWTSGPGAKRGLDDVAWRWRTWLEGAKDKPATGNARSTVADDLKRLEREHAAALAEEARA